MKKTIEEQKAKGADDAGSVRDDVVRSAEEEIAEIQQVLPEIMAKIEDAKDSMRDNSQSSKDKIISEMLNRSPEASPVKKVRIITSIIIIII